ncbi:MAG: HNH endonuclease [Armatimonadetes bacterium]|nr:HNH endonuclease [Armatimonadota bacterium]
MIQVNRGKPPDILTRKRAVWLAAWRKAATPKARAQALARYRHEGIRDALRDAFHGKCAYCESQTDGVTWGHIEHYRPRSRFPELTFDWGNLLWACPRCNSECKGDQFPEAVDGGPIVDPCGDDPTDHLVFDYDPVARLANVYGKTIRGTVTRDLLDLNRPDLRAERSWRVKQLAYLSELAKRDAEARALLEEAKQDDAPYAAFARALDP